MKEQHLELQKQFNQPGLLKEDIQHNYEYGLSPLHARIRFMELVLHTAYDISFGVRGTCKSEENKQNRLAEKATIQSEFRPQMGLIVDTPLVGWCVRMRKDGYRQIRREKI